MLRRATPLIASALIASAPLSGCDPATNDAPVTSPPVTAPEYSPLPPELLQKMEVMVSQLNSIEAQLKQNAQEKNLTEDELSALVEQLAQIKQEAEANMIVDTEINHRQHRLARAAELSLLLLQAPRVSSQVNTIIASLEDYELTEDELALTDTVFDDAKTWCKAYRQTTNGSLPSSDLWPVRNPDFNITGIETGDGMLPRLDQIEDTEKDLQDSIAVARGRATGEYDLDVTGGYSNNINSSWGCPESLICEGAENDEGDPVSNMIGGTLDKLYSSTYYLNGFSQHRDHWPSMVLPFNDFIQSFKTSEGDPLYKEILQNPDELHKYFVALEQGLFETHPFGMIFPEETDNYDSITVSSDSLARDTILDSRKNFLRLLIGKDLIAYVKGYESMILNNEWQKYRPILDHHAYEPAVESSYYYEDIQPGFVKHWDTDRGSVIIPDACGGNFDQWNLHLEYEENTSAEEKFWVRRAWAAETAGGIAPEIMGTYMLRTARRLGIESSSLKSIAESLQGNPAIPANSDLAPWYQQEITLGAADKKAPKKGKRG